jgi:hypothetical protein
MNQVKVDKDQLEDILVANRVSHLNAYEEALAAWKEKVKQELEDAYYAARIGEKFKTSFDLPKPENFVKEYDRTLGMLRMSVDENVTLTDYEYRQYVEDEWDWKQRFATTNSRYTG